MSVCDRGRLSKWAGASGSLILLGAVALQGCGGDDKKKVIAVGGSAGAGAAGGGGSGGIAGSTSSGGGAPVGGGGAGGSQGGNGGGEGGSAGSGGTEPSVPLSPFSMSFSVAPAAQGLPDTAVATSNPNPASNVYTSLGSGAAHLKGTNTLGISFDKVGLVASDDLDAISAVHPVVPSAYLFSVADRSGNDEGTLGSAVRRASDDLEVGGDVFLSYALAPASATGNNIVWTDEVRLGLQPELEKGTPGDELNALDVDIPSGATRIYFSVSPSAQGAEGSAVAQTTASERGCTVFASNLDGTNEVAWTCAQLGLVAEDDVDALVVYGTGQVAHTVLFSVTPESAGADDSAVQNELDIGHAADIFRSQGDGQNSLHVSERALGLNSYDDLDALAIRSAGVPGETWLPPPQPPEDPEPQTPDVCLPTMLTLAENANAETPQSHSNPQIPPRVPGPPTRIKRFGTRLTRLRSQDAERLNALIPCSPPSASAPPALADTVVQVFCDTAFEPAKFRAGDYFLSVIETEQNIDFTTWPRVQVAVVAEVDGNPANNYKAQAPFTNDTFDGGDEVLQLVREGGPMTVRSQRISGNTFTPIDDVPDRVVKFGRSYLFIKILPDAGTVNQARLTFFASDLNFGQTGGDWSMSNVNAVGAPMLIPPDLRCP